MGLWFVQQPYPESNASCDFCPSDQKFAAGFLQLHLTV